MEIKIAILVINIILIIYILLKINTLNKTIKKNAELINRINAFNTEQIHFNELVSKKFLEIDEINLYHQINYYKSINKIGEA